jgi:hypothetical protein
MLGSDFKSESGAGKLNLSSSAWYRVIWESRWDWSGSDGDPAERNSTRWAFDGKDGLAAPSPRGMVTQGRYRGALSSEVKFKLEPCKRRMAS